MKSDPSLIHKARLGDHHAFRMLVRRHKDYVFNLAVRMLKNEWEAEEAAQDVFMKMYQGLGGFKGESKLSTWLFTITYRLCLNRIKKTRPNMVDIQQISETAPGIVSTSNSGLENLEREEHLQRLNTALNRLCPNEAAALTLFYLEELSLEETSRVMGLTIANVKVILHRGRKNMAKWIIPSQKIP